MNKLDTLEKQVEEMKAEIARLKKEGEDPRVKPEFGDYYYTINSYGVVEYSIWDDDSVDSGRFDNGNVFETKELAEKHVKRLKVFNLLWEYARLLNDGSDILYQIRVDSSADVWISCNLDSACGLPSFSSREAAQKAIDLIGEDAMRETFL